MYVTSPVKLGSGVSGEYATSAVVVAATQPAAQPANEYVLPVCVLCFEGVVDVLFVAAKYVGVLFALSAYATSVLSTLNVTRCSFAATRT